MTSYTREFFDGQRDGSYRSAAVVLPIVFASSGIKSIVDFGCGVGAWLRYAEELGLSDLLGLDGEWVATDDLLISKERFRHADLTKPITLGRSYDLAMCLEVAEHLPAASAGVLIDNITKTSDLILFSAAIPLQGGTNHINEQWQDYWVDLFAKRGFAASDTIRPHVWGRSDVEWWYQQNVLLFSKGQQPADRSFNMVHPQHPKLIDNFPTDPSGRQSLRMIKAGSKGVLNFAWRRLSGRRGRR
jgi:SAM-dependent methyltransferase